MEINHIKNHCVTSLMLILKFFLWDKVYNHFKDCLRILKNKLDVGIFHGSKVRTIKFLFKFLFIRKNFSVSNL